MTRLIETLKPDDVVIGGGNAKKLKKLPKGWRLGDNANAFIGGFRLWNKAKILGTQNSGEGSKK